MTLLADLRARRIAPAVQAEAAAYAAGAGDPGALQLERLNDAWASSLALSPWARELRRRAGLPDRFGSWGEFAERVPIMRKSDVREVTAAVKDAEAKAQWRATGGTTAEPVRFPVFPSEAAGAQVDMWLGRARLGVGPADRLFMVWGHAHLFGKGLKGAVARWKRRASDAALGYVRWSAYDLTARDLARAGDALLASRSRYVIGYSTALDRFARVNADRSGDFRRLGLKAVIATAEGFPQADSRTVIEACLGCPVTMEYGTVETGALAYQRPDGGYDVFWARHRLEPVESAARGAARELLVTSLYPRALPLLRYATGDLVAADWTPEPVTHFETIQGRCNDVVELPNGLIVHSEAFTHVIRDAPNVRAFQVVRRAGALPSIRYEAEQPLPEDLAGRLRERFARIDPSLAGIDLQWTPAIARSVAGKHQMVVEES